jgi:hypothetical protein
VLLPQDTHRYPIGSKVAPLWATGGERQSVHGRQDTSFTDIRSLRGALFGRHQNLSSCLLGSGYGDSKL